MGMYKMQSRWILKVFTIMKYIISEILSKTGGFVPTLILLKNYKGIDFEFSLGIAYNTPFNYLCMKLLNLKSRYKFTVYYLIIILIMDSN